MSVIDLVYGLRITFLSAKRGYQEWREQTDIIFRGKCGTLFTDATKRNFSLDSPVTGGAGIPGSLKPRSALA
jgi:hypothetical protein